MKTNRLKALILFFLVPLPAGAGAYNSFECLRDILTVTDRGNFQKYRKGVERPYLLDKKYLVFPEVSGRLLTGFFVYNKDGAWYYDTIENRHEGNLITSPIAGLAEARDRSYYQMVAQPTGLETVTINYVPGFDSRETNRKGPVALGTSVLPIVGAFVSRPDQYDNVYQDPKAVTENRLQEWLLMNSSGRRPATAAEVKIERKIVSLKTNQEKDDLRLWQPLKEELRLRREWIKKHNLDDRSFKELALALDGSCKLAKSGPAPVSF